MPELKLPDPAIFHHGKIPEPLTEELREWLVDQLHNYSKGRVHPSRTMAIGALTDMAVTEFCRLMAQSRAFSPEEGPSIADRIDGLYEEASNNPCTCRTDELNCPYCNAWDSARQKAKKIITNALKGEDA